jgi:hypothetical protein
MVRMYLRKLFEVTGARLRSGRAKISPYQVLIMIVSFPLPDSPVKSLNSIMEKPEFIPIFSWKCNLFILKFLIK